MPKPVRMPRYNNPVADVDGPANLTTTDHCLAEIDV